MTAFLRPVIGDETVDDSQCRFRPVACLTSAFALALTAAMCVATPAAADPTPQNCTVAPGSLRTTCTPVTYAPATTTAPAHKTRVAVFADRLPDLSFWHFLGAGLIVIGLISVYAHRGTTDADARPGTARAGAARAGQRSERSIGWFGVGLGIVALGYALGGIGGLFLGGIVGGLILLPALKTGGTPSWPSSPPNCTGRIQPSSTRWAWVSRRRPHPSRCCRRSQ